MTYDQFLKDSLHVLTSFGDSTITSAFTLVTVIFFLFYRQKRAALAMGTVFFVTASLVSVSKILLYSRCTVLPHSLSPSGHSAMSLAVYGTFAVLVASSQTGTRRIIPFLVAIPLIVLIAVSRFVLKYHSLSDVIIGSGIGFATSFGVWAVFLKGEIVRCRWWPMTVVVLIVIGMLYGLHSPAEDIIKNISIYIRSHLRAC